MGTKLYVANLPNPPSAPALREHFSACGYVSDVEIVPDRHPGRGRASAFVRMGSAASAERARTELNGSSFAGQLLLVEVAPDEAGDQRGYPTRRPEKNEDESRTRITTQFREPANMTYELDCADTAIVLRIFYPTATAEWRVVAQASRAADAPSAASTAPSRVEALRNIARECSEGVAATALARIDWDAVEQAMTKVRAL